MTLSKVVSGLCNRGHKLTVVRPRQRGEVAAGPRVYNANEGFDQWLVKGWQVPFCSPWRFGMPMFRMLHERWSENRPDMVHVATEGPLGYSGLKAARALGIPVTVSFHTNFHLRDGRHALGLGRKLALQYLRQFHNRATCTVVPTDEMAGNLATLGFERLAVLSRGVDTRLFAPSKRSERLRHSWGAAAEDAVVLCAGRMTAEKNLGLAVEAYKAMRLIYPRTRFVLLGDGPLRAELEMRHSDYIFTGMLGGVELAHHYASADVLLFPSVTETFGNVVTEALASGLVVAGYDYAALRQYVRNGINGFSAQLGDQTAFLAMTQDLMNRRATWPVIRAAARVTGQSINWDSVLAQYEAKLAHLVKGR